MITKILNALTGRTIKRENESLNDRNVTLAFQNFQHCTTINLLQSQIDDLEAELASRHARDPKTGRIMKRTKP